MANAEPMDERPLEDVIISFEAYNAVGEVDHDSYNSFRLSEAKGKEEPILKIVHKYEEGKGDYLQFRRFDEKPTPQDLADEPRLGEGNVLGIVFYSTIEGKLQFQPVNTNATVEHEGAAEGEPGKKEEVNSYATATLYDSWQDLVQRVTLDAYDGWVDVSFEESYQKPVQKEAEQEPEEDWGLGLPDSFE